MRHLAGLGAAALLPCAAAWADAPLVSETADAIEPGRCQIEVAQARLRSSGQPAVSAMDAVFSCGAVGRTQAALGYSRERTDGSTAQYVRLVGKTNLKAPEGDKPGWGVRYGIEATKAPGTGWRTETVELLGLVTTEVAPGLLAHANVGHSHARSMRQGSTLWALGIESTGTLSFAGDVYGDDRSRPWLSTGVFYSFGSGFSANAGVAVQFDRPRVQALTIGAKLEF